jgi:polyhydroxyalkanoate synthase
MYAMNWNTADASLGPFSPQALKDMDRRRQAKGAMLERAGYGPQRTPSHVLHAQPGLNLLSYDGAHHDGPPVLLVPAPIKRSYIWDMAPDISVVRRWLERGYRVYLAEWVPTPEGDSEVGLADYGDRLLALCQSKISEDSGHDKMIIAGHSLGGILAAIYSAAHPEKIAATILLEAPLRFAHAHCCFTPLVKATPDARAIANAFRHVPGVFLNMMSAMAEPQAFQWERIIDRNLSLLDPQAMSTHMRVERWTHDEFALPGKLFTEIVESLYRRDDFMQARLAIGARTLGPHDLRAPLMSVVDFRSKVIPPQSVLPFHEAAGSERKQVLSYGGDIGVNLQHVGVLVGRSAHAALWPQIFEWLGAPAATPLLTAPAEAPAATP